MWLVALALVGCGDDTPQECREGTSLAADGHCYPDLSGPDITDLYIANATCDVPEAITIDLSTGCAGPACAGQSLEELEAALGPGDCANASFDLTLIYCTWEELGIDARFDDENTDGIPDEGAVTDRIHLFAPNADQSVEGLAVNVDLGCFFAALGAPEELSTVARENRLEVYEVFWDRWGLRGFDAEDLSGSANQDGRLDQLYLYGQ